MTVDERSASALELLRSAATPEGVCLSTAEAERWLIASRAHARHSVARIPFERLRGWHFEEGSGNLRHESGRFFSVEGLAVETNVGHVPRWEQPILHQPETGLLGFLARRFDGILHLLVQLKFEPGNLGGVQFAPTVQATWSNYTRVHGGREPAHLRSFQDPDRNLVLVDELQPEHGARFLRKRNRNVIVEAPDEPAVSPDHRWLTLGQIQALMRCDDYVNMDARSILACIPFHLAGADALACESVQRACPAQASFRRAVFESTLGVGRAQHALEDVLTWIERRRRECTLRLEPVALARIAGWEHAPSEIRHVRRKFFKVIAVSVASESREVATWTQPIIEPQQVGLVAFVCKRIGGTLHVLVQLKLEPGNVDVLAVAPTVQCITGSWRDVPEMLWPRFLRFVLDAPQRCVRWSSFQSEEGGRFYQEHNQNLVLEVDDDLPADPTDSYRWITLYQLRTLLQSGAYVNVQARNLVAFMGAL